MSDIEIAKKQIYICANFAKDANNAEGKEYWEAKTKEWQRKWLDLEQQAATLTSEGKPQ